MAAGFVLFALASYACAQPPGAPVRGMPERTTSGVKPDSVAGGGINQAGRGNAAGHAGESATGASRASGLEGEQAFDAYDLDGDGLVSQAEAAGHASLVERFERHDANRDGRLTPTEFAETPRKPRARKKRVAPRPPPTVAPR